MCVISCPTFLYFHTQNDNNNNNTNIALYCHHHYEIQQSFSTKISHPQKMPQKWELWYGYCMMSIFPVSVLSSISYCNYGLCSIHFILHFWAILIDKGNSLVGKHFLIWILPLLWITGDLTVSRTFFIVYPDKILYYISSWGKKCSFFYNFPSKAIHPSHLRIKMARKKS